MKNFEIEIDDEKCQQALGDFYEGRQPSVNAGPADWIRYRWASEFAVMLEHLESETDLRRASLMADKMKVRYRSTVRICEHIE